MINSIVWILWLTANMIFILSTRNPIYLVVVMFGLFYLGQHLAKRRNYTTWVLSNIRFLLTMIFLSTVINGLFSHVGRSVLFTIPPGWPLIGGDITLESLAYGALNGLVIGALFILFNIINFALSTKQITRLIPRVFHPVAMMVTIALTFFPSIQERAREIKEAQIIRGNPMKKISDWVPILIPLLVTSLEKAILLAESMTARGFHKQVDLRKPNNLISLMVGAFSVFSGWILQLYRYPIPLSVTLYVAGGALIVMTVIRVGKQVRTTRYHREDWRPIDISGALISTVYVLSFSLVALTNRLSSLSYSPYPQLTIPRVQITGIIFSLLPFLPVFTLHHD